MGAIGRVIEFGEFDDIEFGDSQSCDRTNQNHNKPLVVNTSVKETIPMISEIMRALDVEQVAT